MDRIFFTVDTVGGLIVVRSTITNKLVQHKVNNHYRVRYWKDVTNAQSWVNHRNMIANNLIGKRR